MITPEQEHQIISAIHKIANREVDQVSDSGISAYRQGQDIVIDLFHGPVFDLEPDPEDTP